MVFCCGSPSELIHPVHLNVSRASVSTAAKWDTWPAPPTGVLQGSTEARGGGALSTIQNSMDDLGRSNFTLRALVLASRAVKQIKSEDPGDCGVAVREVGAGPVPWQSPAPNLQGRDWSCPPPQLFSGCGRNRTCVGEGKENRTETRDF